MAALAVIENSDNSELSALIDIDLTPSSTMSAVTATSAVTG
jgi:hypothetical protein